MHCCKCHSMHDRKILVAMDPYAYSMRSRWTINTGEKNREVDSTDEKRGRRCSVLNRGIRKAFLKCNICVEA